MKQGIVICMGLIVILFMAGQTWLSGAKTPFKFPDAIKYDIYEQGKLISTCTYTYEKAAQGKDYLVLTMECTRPITANNADRFATTISDKDFSVLISNGARGHDGIFNVEISEIKGENKFIMKYSGGKDHDKKQREISSPHPVIDFLSFFIVGSKRVADGNFKKDQSFNLLEGTQVNVVNMKYLKEDKASFHGMALDVEVLALVHGNDQIYSLKVRKDDDGYIYPLHAGFSDIQHTLEMRATKVQKPQGAQSSKRILYLSTLSFLDAAQGSIENPSEAAQLITNVFIKELHSQVTNIEAARGVGVIKNLGGHTIPDEDGNVQKLMDIIFSTASKKERIDEIIREFMTPYHVDIVVTGQYIDYPDRSTFSIRPVMVFKSHQEIVTRNFLLNKSELLTLDVNNKKVLHLEAPQKIEEKVRELLTRYPGAAPVKTVTSSTQPPVKTVQKQPAPTTSPTQKQQKPPTQPATSQPQPKTTPTQPVRTSTPAAPTALQEPIPMTVEDVYRMVIDNKFYCSWGDDQHHHKKVIDKLKIEKIVIHTEISGGSTSDGKTRHCSVLKSGWNVTTKTLPKGGIKTITIPKKGAASYSNVLYWTTSEIKDKIYNYHEARELVRDLNDKNHFEYSDWRIPTMVEIFLVLDDPRSTGNFFPFDNKLKKLKSNIRLWTSTPVDKKEGEIFGGCNADAYFVFNNTHDGNFHSITFAVGCSEEEAHVLLVRSDQSMVLPVPPKPPSTAVRTPTTPSTKTRAKPPKTKTKPRTKPKKVLNVDILPYWDADNLNVLDSLEVKLINKVVFAVIKKWAGQSKTNIKPVNPKYQIPAPGKAAKKIIEITFDTYLPSQNRMEKMKNTLKIPGKVGVIITGRYSEPEGAAVVMIRPVVIFISEGKILTRNIPIQKGELMGRDPDTKEKLLAIDVKRRITQVIEQALEDTFK